MPKFTIAFFILTTSICYSQSLHDDVKSIYDFSPAKLSRDEQKSKIPLMDAFWNKVKSDTTKYLPELRNELQIEGNPKFFYFEGGQLLLTLSNAVNDKQIVLDGILKSDLDDIDRRTLVATLNYLAKAKLNTTAAALKILDDKEFEFFLPEHSFYFNQGYSLTYALLPTDPAFYLTALTDRFKTEKDIKTQKSIVTFLWFANTCDGNEFLKQLVTNGTVNKEIADYANDLLTRELKKQKYYKELNSMSFQDLIKAQTVSTSRMSDEAIYELDYITKLMRKIDCRKQ